MKNSALLRLLHHDAAPGILLVIAAALAMVIANSPLQTFYSHFLAIPAITSIGSFVIEKPLLLWINDGLMAVFFFLIGLEVKREMIEGHLSSRSQLVLPLTAAVGGIAVPALIYWAMNGADPIAARGWAIPAATDIAFALGVYGLIGNRLPASLKLFLLSVAIFDDIGAIVIIALFYSQELSGVSLLVALAGLAVLMLMNRLRVMLMVPYLLVGLVVWAAVLKSGVHATLAGFAAAWFIPLVKDVKTGESPLAKLEHDLHPWVMFFILPLFAFANAGVTFIGIPWSEMFNMTSLGIALGLFFGKQIGIVGLSWCVIQMGWAKLPKGANWLQFYAVSLLCGIGFTMSLFIGSLAFEGLPVAYLNSVKIGVVMGSVLSALTAFYLLKLSIKATELSPDSKSSETYDEARV